MKTGNTNTPAEFDQLLSMALLERTELFNETTNTVMIQHVLTSQEIPALKNHRVAEQLNKHFKTGKYFLNWWLLLFLIPGIAAVVAWKMRAVTPETAAVYANVPSPSPSPLQQTVITGQDNSERKTIHRDAEIVMPVSDTLLENTEVPEQIIAPAFFNHGKTGYHIPEPVYYEEEEIPFVTDDQVKRNEKRKLQMLRDISKQKSFKDVPAGPAWRNNERFEVNAFSMQCAEVSNWQYNLFLEDLLADGRNDDYLAAKPVNGNWKTVGIPEYENTYAKDKGYEKFPVLNIPRAGAEMYCRWLTAEMNAAIDKKDVKWSQAGRPDFRLPSDIEWLRAARGNDSTLQFPWGAYYNALQNTRGCYLCNFNYSVSKDVLTPIESDGKNCISEKKTTRAVVTTAGRSIDTLVLGPEYCYNPTTFGHYCLMGNAAEMVWTYDAAQPTVHGAARAMGGSWYSHADNVRIESKEQFVGVTEGNVNIGFRVVY